MVLHPAILALGALAAVVPIVIHLLLRRRRQPVQWGAMRLIIEAYRSTRRRRLERWLLLATRVALLLAAGLILARPIIGRTASTSAAGDRTVWIVVDDSLTSAALGPDGNTELAQTLAIVDAQLASLGQADRAGVVLASAPARALISPPSADIAAVRAALAQLKPTDARADWSGAIALTGAAAGTGAAASSQPAPTGPRTTQLLLASAWRAGSMVDGPQALAGAVRAALAAHARGPGSEADPPGSADPAPVAGVQLLVTAPAQPTGRDSNVAILAARALRPLVLSAERDLSQAITIDLARSGSLLAGELSSVSVKDPSGAALGQGEVRWSRGQRTATITLPLAPPTLAPGTQAGQPSPGPAGLGLLRVEVEAPAQLDAGASPRQAPGAIAGDDRATLALVERETVRVGLVESASLGPGAGPGLVQGLDQAASSAPASRLRASQWVRLALRPSEASPIDVVDVPASSIERPVLAGLDALWILSPQALDEQAWARVARFAGQGGVLIFSPPAQVASHLWPAQAMRALGLPWRFAPTASTAPAQQPARLVAQALSGARPNTSPSMSPSPSPGASTGTSTGPGATAQSPASSQASSPSQTPPPPDAVASALLDPQSPDILANLKGELDELVSPVAITQWLSPDLSGQVQAQPGIDAAGQASLSTSAGPPRVLLGVGVDETGGLTEPLALVARAQPLLASTDSSPIAGSSPTSSAGPAQGASARGSSGGLIIYLGVAPDLSWTDLPAKPLFVALVQEFIRQGVGGARRSQSLTAGQRAPLPGVLQLRALATGAVVRVETFQANPGERATSAAPDWPRSAGLFAASDASGASLGQVLVNPDAFAGDIDPTDPAQLAVMLTGRASAGPAGGPGAPPDQGQPRPDISPDQRVDEPIVQWLARAGGDQRGASPSRGTDARAGQASPDQGAGARSAARSTTPIGAGPALLVIVLTLACVELALAWLTSRPSGPLSATGARPAGAPR
jgi:hypothetical protein